MPNKTERIAEMPITEVRYVRIMIRIEHPDLPASRSYALMEDVRLMDLRAIKRPNAADQLEWHEWAERRNRRTQLIGAMSAKIAHAMYAAFDEMEK